MRRTRRRRAGRHDREMGELVAGDMARRRRAIEAGDRTIWDGLSLFGIVGWSVSIPTLIGIAVGLWLDSRFPNSIAWTITCMVAGVLLGSLNAWYWVTRESRKR